jgi:hypothetical protein
MVSGRDHDPEVKEETMHPVILQDLASEHVRDMQLAAPAARRARRAGRARRGSAAAPRFSAMASDMSVRHA